MNSKENAPLKKKKSKKGKVGKIGKKEKIIIIKELNKKSNILISTNSDLKIFNFTKIAQVNNSNKQKNEKQHKIINDYELNNLPYNDAIKIDKRTYIQYYFSLLKTKHIILFTFYIRNDYNSKIIKLILFLFSISLYLALNALFFNDSTMHKIYIYKGNFKIIYQIKQIIYSSIISSVINTIIRNLSLTERNIVQLKNEKSNKIEKGKKLLKLLFIKFIIFFILIFIFLLLFWYYISCFCVIYKNTQILLIKDSVISFGISLLFPFILLLFPGTFRIYSLKKENSECIYKISRIFQFAF